MSDVGFENRAKAGMLNGLSEMPRLHKDKAYHILQRLTLIRRVKYFGEE